MSNDLDQAWPSHAPNKGKDRIVDGGKEGSCHGTLPVRRPCHAVRRHCISRPIPLPDCRCVQSRLPVTGSLRVHLGSSHGCNVHMGLACTCTCNLDKSQGMYVSVVRPNDLKAPGGEEERSEDVEDAGLHSRHQRIHHSTCRGCPDRSYCTRR